MRLMREALQMHLDAIVRDDEPVPVPCSELVVNVEVSVPSAASVAADERHTTSSAG